MENKTSFRTKALAVATITTAILSLVYIAIRLGYPLAQGEIFRLWFIRTLPIILLLALIVLTIIWTVILSRVIKSRGEGSLLGRILLWAAGIILVISMCFGILAHLLYDHSEHYNSNGTVTVKTPVWLDEPSFKLYKEKNFLTLQFLRNADRLEDIDPSITQQEYLHKKQMAQGLASESQANSQSSKGSLTKEEKRELAKQKKIDEGYLKIYQTYLSKTDPEYRKEYNAKGNSYIVTFEDDAQIRYLMYDRDIPGEAKSQYVYYTNTKDQDGSWSIMDAEILGMYQYDYRKKEPQDLDKTSW